MLLEPLAVLCGHVEETRVWQASWSFSGLYLATCGEDRIIHIWAAKFDDWEKTDDIGCIATLEDGHARTVRSLCWSPDDKMIASASFDGTIVIWEAQSSAKTYWDQIASLEGHDNEVKCVCWSCEGTRLASCGRDKHVWIWEKLGSSEFECVAMLEGHTQDVKSVCWHPSELILLSASYDDCVKVWVEDNDEWFCLQTINCHSSTIWGVSFSADGQRFVSCSDDKSIVVYQNDGANGGGTWRSIASLKEIHRFPIFSIDWCHHTDFIVTGGGDNAIAISRQGKGQDDPLQLEFVVGNAHAGDVNCVRWNPAENYAHIIASTGDDGLVRLWRIIL